jgi:hypothetical protein
VPLFVLGAAIGWPDSLGDPAATMLPRLLEHQSTVRLGYAAFFAHSLLFLPAAVIIAHYAAGTPGRGMSMLATLAVAFAALSTLARCIGIVRWLGPAMVLAARHQAADPASRASIEMAQDTINLYAGTVGEVLGDVVFGGLFLLTVAILILRESGLPRWLGLAAVPASLIVLAPVLEIFGLPHPISISLSSATMQFWMIAVGAILFWRGLKVPSEALMGHDR